MTKKQDLAWWQKTIAYEIYPKSFYDTAAQGTGTIAGITAKLDYLASLGVGAIWITPCYKSPMVDNGYDVEDYRQIDPSFGTMADMDELIAKGNEKGVRVVMDLVFNHTSEQCAWFKESRKSRDNAYADWYIWRDARPDGSAPTNWRSIFGSSAAAPGSGVRSASSTTCTPSRPSSPTSTGRTPMSAVRSSTSPTSGPTRA